MNEKNEVWYTITSKNNWEAVETCDIEHAREALRDKKKVLKTTLKMFDSGSARVRLDVTVEITKIADL